MIIFNAEEPLEIVQPAFARAASIGMRLCEIDAQTAKPRTMRELALNNASTIDFVTKLDAEAATLRAELATL